MSPAGASFSSSLLLSSPSPMPSLSSLSSSSPDAAMDIVSLASGALIRSSIDRHTCGRALAGDGSASGTRVPPHATPELSGSDGSTKAAA